MHRIGIDVEGLAETLRHRAGSSLRSLRNSEVGRGVHRLHDGAQRTLEGLQTRAVRVLNRGDDSDDYSVLRRRKTGWELVRLSGAVCGIEFCYAAETAFVSPLLLHLGVKIEFLSMIWCLSPLIGFFLAPFLGSLSDACKWRLGRRRPFILGLSAGIVLGLILVPNGRDMGLAAGDEDFDVVHNATDAMNFIKNGTKNFTRVDNVTEYIVPSPTKEPWHRTWHPRGIAFTVLGAVLLDLCSDACQSPARTYLLDVTVPEDHVTGLSVFTVLAGLGGAAGYVMGAIEWEATFVGHFFGSHERAVFAIVSVFFVICLFMTVTSFKEIPLDVLQRRRSAGSSGGYREFANEPEDTEDGRSWSPSTANYGAVYSDTKRVNGESGNVPAMAQIPSGPEDEEFLIPAENRSPSLREYLHSILVVPRSLRILCLTNLFCWMSLVCYSLYFTDFVGESVFGGDPRAPETDFHYKRYQAGVRFGCWGMALYSISCSFYSYSIEKFVKRFGARRVYVGGQLVYSVGMVVMAATRHKVSVILLSPTAGVMYATLFTMPYLLVAHYHAKDTFSLESPSEASSSKRQQVRGIGTDVAVVGSMVFLSQFLLSTFMGGLVSALGSSVVTICAAVVLSAAGAFCATKVLYLDL